MSLDTSHYTLLPLPLGAKLCRLWGKQADTSVPSFALVIPSVVLLNLDVRPTISVSVDVCPAAQPRVVISVLRSRVEGRLVESLGLNERFLIWGATRLTWPSDEAMDSETEVFVGIDPPAPFSLLPPALLERVGNAVLNAVCDRLQRVFMRSLGEDYARWAGDEAYRRSRAVQKSSNGQGESEERAPSD
jgi:hypothetical protein